MWPVSGREIAQVCAGACALPELAELRIAGVKADGARPEVDDLFVALREPAYDFDGHDWVLPYLHAGAALALVAADWPLLNTLPPLLRQRCIVVADTLRAFRQLAAWLRRRFSFPVVAVGGSNGKTTTKDMIAALLSGPGFRVSKTPGNLNGYTGIPLTVTQREHARATAPHALVAEIGIDGPLAMAEHAALLLPEVAVLTALGPEHLAGLGSWEAAVAEEFLLFAGAAPTRRVFQACDAQVYARLPTARRGDIIVCDGEQMAAAVCTALGGDGDRKELMRRGISLLTLHASCAAPLHSEVTLTWYDAAAERTEPSWRGCLHVPMAGRHNADNLAAAFGAALAIGRNPDALLRGWPSFQPPARRGQSHPLPDGGILLDDTYNASPSSMAAALALLHNPAWRARRKVLILGDMLDLGSATAQWHRELCEPLHALDNTQLFLFGDAMSEVHRRLTAMGSAAEYLPATADPRAFLTHPAAAPKGNVVLVKGSRGLRLERVVDQILFDTAGSFPPSAGPQTPPHPWGRWQLQFSDVTANRDTT